MGMSIEDTLIQAKMGDELARERLIRQYKPYIQNSASHTCNRYVSWSDEETSIALIAFNKAIDSFDPNGGRAFQSYAYLIIRRDLIDFFRKENQETHLSMNTDEDFSSIENGRSVELYDKSVQSNNLVDEILELDEQLKQYKISFEEIESFCPQHKDTRESLFLLADEFICDEECVNRFLKKKLLPTSLFASKTSWKQKTLERHRKYIITLILIKLNPHWLHLRQYIERK